MAVPYRQVAVYCTIFALLTLDETTGQDDFLWDTFPDGFQWGAATSAYQIEGGWDADGKGESNWDRWCHTGNNVANNDTGDTACDSYNRYNEDIVLLKNLGVHFYRFSLSWSRILPDGTLNIVNKAGIDYYNRLIDGLLAEGIQPMVTLFHWDLPQALEDDGGWLNPSIVSRFNDYADLCFERFGDRVKLWLTFNEPWVVAWVGYGIGMFPPGMNSPDVGAYQATHNLIKAHAAAWHTYDDKYRSTQNGRISITLDSDWKEPASDSPEDIEAAERAMQFKLGWFGNAIYVNGDYSEVMKTKIAEKSQLEGRNTSRLPEFTLEEKTKNLGTHDFFGLNHYVTQLVTYRDHETEWPSWDYDRDVDESFDPTWPETGSEWTRVVPWGLRKLLVWIKDNYNNPEVMITENGCPDDAQHYGSLDDQPRIDYYTAYINNVLKAVKQDGCDVSAYTAWSLMDNFEWNSGYEMTFGLHRINFTDPELRRIPKASAAFYEQLIADNGWSTPKRS